MEIAATRVGRLESLTGLRFVAAMLVFAHHLPPLWAGVAGIGWLDRFVFDPGASGVSFFFILSGFVLTVNLSEPPDARTFYLRRVARLYPIHFLTAMIALPLGIAALGDLVLNLSLLQSWVPDPTVYYSLNTPSWSLSCEAFFYLLFPFAVATALRHRRDARLGRVFALVVGLIVVAQLGATALGGEDGSTGRFLGYIFPPTRFLEFVLGVVLALAYHRLPRIDLRVALAACGLAVLVAGFVPPPAKWVIPTLLPFIAVLIAAAQRDERDEPSLFRTHAIRTLGAWSFAFYLLHQLVLHYFIIWTNWSTSSAVAATEASALVLAVSLGLSALVYARIERPAGAWARRRWAVGA